jgi:glutaminyl-tRNA synthetase
MPPKFNPDDPATASLITLFTSLGVAPASATELVKQPKQGQAFKGLIDEFKLEETEYKGKLDEKQGAALVKLATTGGKLGQAEKGFVVQKVLKGDLKSGDQVTGEYCTVE